MARWLCNRPPEHCHEHEIKVAKLFAKITETDEDTPTSEGKTRGAVPAEVEN